VNDKAVILIVDDLPSNIQTLAMVLKESYQIKVATDGERALELAQQEPLPDLILLDIEMPGMNGYEVCQRLKKSDMTKAVPVIFVTGNNATEDEEYGLQLGAVDYITKPVRPAIVQARIRTHITLKQQYDKLRSIAMHDQLTGVYNRHYLNDTGRRKFSRAKRHATDLSVILVDIDHFKAINDNEGHLTGDKILIAVAALLSSTNRAEDFTARFGGEEFVILLEHCDGAAATAKAEQLRQMLADLHPEGLKVTASFGVAQLGERHENIESLLKEADQALYSAKESGRNRVILAE
jgi:diguanylate cyclase (GGDEF)-like protein